MGREAWRITSAGGGVLNMSELEAPKILNPQGKPVESESKHNLLLFTGTDVNKTYDAWQEKVDRLTKQKIELVDPADGQLQTYEDSQYGMTKAEKLFNPKSLPPEFCPNCNFVGRNHPGSKSKSIFIIVQEYPGLDLKPGNAIEHYVHDRCARALINLEGDDSDVISLEAAPTVRANKKRARALEIQDNIIAYIQNKRLTSQPEDSSIFGEDSRRERFADKEDEQ